MVTTTTQLRNSRFLLKNEEVYTSSNQSDDNSWKKLVSNVKIILSKDLMVDTNGNYLKRGRKGCGFFEFKMDDTESKRHPYCNKYAYNLNIVYYFQV